MKFRNHILIQVPIFFLLSPFLKTKNSLIICLFHFIPTLDYLAMKFRLLKSGYHRKLCHNIFITIIAAFILFYFTKNIFIASLGFLNIIFHFILDKFKVDFFFPLSYLTYKTKKYE